MPVLDRRTIERSRYVLAAQQIEGATTSIFGEKGYAVETVDLTPSQREHLAAITADADSGMPGLVGIVPGSAKRILVVYLDLLDVELNSPTVDFRVRMSATLIDPKTQVVLWHGSAEGYSNRAGVFSALSPSSTQYEAIYRGLTNLFHLPGGDEEHA